VILPARISHRNTIGRYHHVLTHSVQVSLQPPHTGQA
jgi:hypothetical protein